MKSDLRKEVDAILTNKLNDAIKAYQAQRDQDFEELVALKKAVETLEAEKAGIVEAMKGLNTRRAADLGEYNRLTRTLSGLDRRQLKAKRGQVDALMDKLTELEINPKMLTLFLTYHEKEGNKNEQG